MGQQLLGQQALAGERLDAKAFASIGTVEWRHEPKLAGYAAALAQMDTRVQAILDKSAPELVWLLEHPPLYTAGTSAVSADLLTPRFPVHETGRGGQYTYHGPGQRVAYVMLDLKHRNAMDIRKYVFDLEEWIIRTLRHFDVGAERRPGRVGLWVRSGTREAKIAAIGVRVRRWVTLHGAAINVAPDLAHYNGIVPCGIREHGITSLAELGIGTTMEEVDAALQKSWNAVFGF